MDYPVMDLILLLIAGAEGCSIYCEENSQTIGNSLLRSELAVKAYIWKDISPPPKNPFLPWDTKFFQGRVNKVFKGQDEISTGKLVFAGGACGSGYQEGTQVLLFGDVHERTVEGFAAPIPVFFPTSCSPSPTWNSLDNATKKRLRNYSSAENACMPEDCGLGGLSYSMMCPDGTEVKSSSTCEVMDGQCSWQTEAPPACP